jgi:creatinine amidohydrolase/Fe(II)-dependent formamide hydrolase-like protein
MVADEFPTPYSAGLWGFAQYAGRRRDTSGGSGVMGNPLVASAEKGERLSTVIVQKVVQLAGEMHRAPVRQYREFGSHCP